MSFAIALLLFAVDPAEACAERARFAGDPAALPPVDIGVAQLCDLQWMFGTWESTIESINGEPDPFAGPVDPALATIRPVLGGTWLEIHVTWPSRIEDRFYIGYSRDEERWLSVSIESTGHSNRATARAEPGTRLAFEGQVLASGGNSTRQRRIFERRGPDEFTIVTEIRDGNGWSPLETSRFRRRGPTP